MKEITIQIPEMGKMPGTTAWLAEALANARLSVGVLKDHNVPAMWIEFKKGPDEYFHKEFLCCIQTTDTRMDFPDCETFNGCVVAPLFYNSTYGGNGLFTVLTDAAFNIADKWRDRVVKEFYEKWNSL